MSKDVPGTKRKTGRGKCRCLKHRDTETQRKGRFETAETPRRREKGRKEGNGQLKERALVGASCRERPGDGVTCNQRPIPAVCGVTALPLGSIPISRVIFSKFPESFPLSMTAFPLVVQSAGEF